ncbi:MAG: hypothetical protein HYV09_19500 [Deltaproteobacteria bacterium]|nr:hypothetical protein [Deltaproteobacteria bacterium]
MPFDRDSILPTSPARYEVELTVGTPMALSALEHAFVAARGPNQINAYDFELIPGSPPSMKVDFDFMSPLEGPPATLHAIVPNGPASEDYYHALVGIDGSLRWLGFQRDVAVVGARTANFRLRPGFSASLVTASSPTPYFEISTHDAIVAMSSPNGLGWANFDAAVGSTDNADLRRAWTARTLVGLGLPDGQVAGVVGGVDAAWAAIRAPGAGAGRFVRLAPATLNLLGSPASLRAGTIPIAIDGGRLLPSDYSTGTGLGSPPASIDYVVVAMHDPARTSSFLTAFPHGNPAATTTRDSTPVPGEVVALRVTVCTSSEYAYMATRNPNRVYKFNVDRRELIWTLELDQPPLAAGGPVRRRAPLPNGLFIGTQSAGAMAAGDPTVKRKEECRPGGGSTGATPGDEIQTATGYVHVLVSEGS